MDEPIALNGSVVRANTVYRRLVERPDEAPPEEVSLVVILRGRQTNLEFV